MRGCVEADELVYVDRRLLDFEVEGTAYAIDKAVAGIMLIRLDIQWETGVNQNRANTA
jgi:hypothetical protein